MEVLRGDALVYLIGVLLGNDSLVGNIGLAMKTNQPLKVRSSYVWRYFVVLKSFNALMSI